MWCGNLFFAFSSAWKHEHCNSMACTSVSIFYGQDPCYIHISLPNTSPFEGDNFLGRIVPRTRSVCMHTREDSVLVWWKQGFLLQYHHHTQKLEKIASAQRLHLHTTSCLIFCIWNSSQVHIHYFFVLAPFLGFSIAPGTISSFHVNSKHEIATRSTLHAGPEKP